MDYRKEYVALAREYITLQAEMDRGFNKQHAGLSDLFGRVVHCHFQLCVYETLSSSLRNASYPEFPEDRVDYIESVVRYLDKIDLRESIKAQQTMLAGRRALG